MHGCSKNEIITPEDINPDNIGKMEFIILNSSDYEQPVPRMVFSCGDWSGVEISEHPGSDHTTFVFVNNEESYSMLVNVTTSSISFMEYDPLNDIIGNEIYSVTIANNKIRHTLFEADWRSGTVKVLTTLSEPAETANSLSLSAITRDSFDDSIRKTVFDYFTKIGDRISTMGDAIDVAGGRTGFFASKICDFWNLVVIPAAKYKLYSDSPEKIPEIVKEQTESVGQYFTLNILFGDYMYLYKAAKLVYRGHTMWHEDGNLDDLVPNSSDEDEESYLRSISTIYNRSERMYTYNQEIGVLEDKYTLSVNVSEITESSADIYGMYSQNDGMASFISEMGIKYGRKSGGIDNIITVASLPSHVVLNNLASGTEYWVVAYLKSFGTEYISPKKFFMTKMVFDLYPTSLTYPAQGGSRGVAVTVPELWTWKITSVPSWCNITGISNGAFFIDAVENKEKKERSGEIVVTANSTDSKTFQKSVKVSQSAATSSWDNTKWSFSGSITTKATAVGATSEYTTDIDFVLEIISVEQQKFSLSGDSSNKSTKISCDSDNHLILDYEDSILQDGVSVSTSIQIIFERVDETNAIGKLKGTTALSTFSNINYSGQLKGSLIK